MTEQEIEQRITRMENWLRRVDAAQKDDWHRLYKLYLDLDARMMAVEGALYRQFGPDWRKP